jgi:hypothetical protein
MINETREFDASPEGIAAELAGDYDWKQLPPDAQKAVVEALSVFFALEADEREAFLKLIGNFVCTECGAPSCLCGYPDD